MTPTKAIESLDELRKEFNRRLHVLSLEMDDIAEQWGGLGRAGGQRDDHAASLMSRLRPIVSDLSGFATRVEKQIDQWVADPFGRKE